MRSLKKAVGAFVAAGVVASTAGIALAADGIVFDGDAVTAEFAGGGPGNEHLALGNICAGTAKPAGANPTSNVLLAVHNRGNGLENNSFSSSTTVTFALDSIDSGGAAPANGAVSASVPASPNNQVVLPSNWSSLALGAKSDTVDATVIVSVPSGAAPGSYTKGVKWTASGHGRNGGNDDNPQFGTVTQTSDTMNVTWTVLAATNSACVSAPPADTTAPTTVATAKKADNNTYTFGNWTNQNVTVTLSASDNNGGSGVDMTRYTLDGTTPDASTGTVYSAPFTITDEGTTTVKFLSIDNDGNAETPQSVAVKIDKTAPTVSVTGPTNGATYLSGAVPTRGCQVTELLSGLASGGTLQADSGGPLGSVTTSCSAPTDNAGNVGQGASVTYTVLQVTFGPNFDGLGKTTAKAGSTVPLKWYFFDGTNYVQPVTRVTTGVALASGACTGTPEPVEASSELADPGQSGLQFLDDGTYQFNWKTTKNQTGCQRITVRMYIGDSTTPFLTKTTTVDVLK